VELSTGVLCTGGWLDWLLPLPPPGTENVGRRSTVPVGATLVGGTGEYELLNSGLPNKAPPAIDAKTMLASTTITTASMNTL